MALTIDQQRAIALASARARAAGDAPAPAAPSIVDKLLSEVRGLRQGLYDIPQSVIEMGARGTDAVGLSDGAYPALHKEFTRDAEMMAPGINSGDKFASGGRMVGQVAATAPMSAVRVIPAATKIAPFARAVINGMVQGGTTASLTSSSSDDPLLEQVGKGVAIGGAAPVLARTAAAVIKPTIAPAVQALLDRKIPLTVGQTLGGAAKDIEDKATSIPLIGSAIKAAQGRATKGLNRTAFDDVLKPIGEKLPKNVPVGREAVDYTATRLGDEYEKVLSGMTAKGDQKFIDDLTSVIADAKGKLPDAQFEQFRKIVQSQISGKAGPGPAVGASFDGSTLQGMNSELKRLASGYKVDPSFDNRELGSAIEDVHKSFRDMVVRNNPGKADALAATDAAYARFARVRRAAGGAGAKDGVFSAPQLQNAVKASDKSAGKGAFARGKALMQDLSDPAVSVLPSSVPDSGTAGRAFASAALFDGLAHINPKVLIGGLAAGGLYSGPGQALLRAVITKRPQAAGIIAEMLRRKAGLAAPAGAGLLSGTPTAQLANQE